MRTRAWCGIVLLATAAGSILAQDTPPDPGLLLVQAKDKDKDAPKKNKKTGEKCKGDGDCATGHCHTKRDGGQVCVDCSKKEIGDFLGIKDRFCKSEPRSCSGLSLDDDVFEFESRIDNGQRCIGARNAENQRCFRGADPGHQTAVKEAEKARANCKKKLDDKLERDTAPGS